jgi:hypothetical protein
LCGFLSNITPFRCDLLKNWKYVKAINDDAVKIIKPIENVFRLYIFGLLFTGSLD